MLAFYRCELDKQYATHIFLNHLFNKNHYTWLNYCVYISVCVCIHGANCDYEMWKFVLFGYCGCFKQHKILNIVFI